MSDAPPFDPTSSYLPDSGSPEVDVLATPDQQAQPAAPQSTPSYAASPDQGGPVPSSQADPDAGSNTHGWRAVLKGALSGLESHLKGAGQGLITGGIPGAVVGAVNPQMAQNALNYRRDTLQADLQQHQAAARSAMDDANFQAQNHPLQLAMAQTHLAQLNAQFNSMPKDLQDRIMQEGAEAGAQLQRTGIEPVFSGSEEDARAHLQARMQVNSDAPLNVTMLPNARGGFDVYELPSPDKAFNHDVSLTIGHDLEGKPITKTYPAGTISIARALNLETAAWVDESKFAAKVRTANLTGVTQKNEAAANKSNATASGSGTPKAENFLVGTDADGNQIAGTKDELAASGVKSFSKLPAADASKVVAARELVSPDGLFSLIAGDMKALGPQGLNAVGSRFNEFMSGKVGAGDDNYTRLRTHVRLLSSALMQAHVGSRGSEAMLEEFRGLADQGKMNSQTLKSALAAEYDYVHGRALLPRKAAK